MELVEVSPDKVNNINPNSIKTLKNLLKNIEKTNIPLKSIIPLHKFYINYFEWNHIKKGEFIYVICADLDRNIWTYKAQKTNNYIKILKTKFNDYFVEDSNKRHFFYYVITELNIEEVINILFKAYPIMKKESNHLVKVIYVDYEIIYYSLIYPYVVINDNFFTEYYLPNNIYSYNFFSRTNDIDNLEIDYIEPKKIENYHENIFRERKR